MAVFKVTSALSPELKYDPRWRQWAKRVDGPEHVDLKAKNGYSLTGPFVKWGQAVAMEPGQFLVVASEAGSAKHKAYTYALITVGDDDQPRQVSKDEIDEAVAAAPDEQKAKALNSRLYAFAVYCSQQFALRGSRSGETAEAGVSTLSCFSDADLIAELRRRGYIVTRAS